MARLNKKVIGAGLGKLGKIAFVRLSSAHIKRLAGPAHRIHNRGTKGDVRHEFIHDVDMDQSAPP
jgi:hypothetical protein